MILSALGVGLTAAPAGLARQPCVVTGPKWVLDNGMPGAQHKVIRGTKYTMTLSAIGGALPPTCSFATAWLPKLLRRNVPRPTGRPGSQTLVGGPPGFTCTGQFGVPPNVGFYFGKCERFTTRADGGKSGSALVWRVRAGTG